MQLESPCVIFAFNRPLKLKKVLTSLRKQEINNLMIFIDGPRNDNDEPNVERCRRISEEIDWVDTEIFLHDKNIGISNLFKNLDIVFKKYSKAIVIEDDCLPMPGFVNFMIKALYRYENESQVFSISGYQPIQRNYFKNYPYSLISSARFNCWGWGSWRDRWELISPLVSNPRYLKRNLYQTSSLAGIDFPFMAEIHKENPENLTWAIKVAFACLALRKVHLITVQGLIKNIGFDLTGIHASRKNFLLGLWLHNRNIAKDISDPIWLDNVNLNCDYAFEIMDFVSKTRQLSIKKIKRRFQVLSNRYLFNMNENYSEIKLENIWNVIPNKKALLSYITYPFSITRDEQRFYNNINIWITQSIVRILNRTGYIVDVIDYRDTDFIPTKPYDLFIGHGGINFEKISKELTAAKKIYLSTGGYWKYHNYQEEERFIALKKRRGVELPYDRYILHSEEAALKIADGVIGFGNQFTKETYEVGTNIIMIPNATLYDDHFNWCKKDYKNGRLHFLYYAGRGCVHKGLDLLLEAFLELPQHLWICSYVERKFAKAYSNELNNYDNIHLVGWVKPRSRQYYDVMQKCDFCILPSASEGSPGSVIECLNQGVIPIISRAAGIDCDDFGIILDPISIENIREVIQLVSKYEVSTIKQMSNQAREEVRSKYSEECFIKNFQQSLLSILHENN